MTSSTGGTEGLGGTALLSNWLSSPVFEPARSRLTAIATATATGGGLALEFLAVGVSLLVALTAAFLALYKDKPWVDRLAGPPHPGRDEGGDHAQQAAPNQAIVYWPVGRG